MSLPDEPLFTVEGAAVDERGRLKNSEYAKDWETENIWEHGKVAMLSLFGLSWPRF